jgi:hypothetical protein
MASATIIMVNAAMVMSGPDLASSCGDGCGPTMAGVSPVMTDQEVSHFSEFRHQGAR